MYEISSIFFHESDLRLISIGLLWQLFGDINVESLIKSMMVQYDSVYMRHRVGKCYPPQLCILCLEIPLILVTQEVDHILCDKNHIDFCRTRCDLLLISMIWMSAKLMVMSWHGNAFRITDPLLGESNGDRKIPLNSKWCGALIYFLWCQPEHIAENTIDGHVNWDIMFIWRHCAEPWIVP